MGNFLESSNLMDNEILKAVDVNKGFTAQITNVSKALQSIIETRQDVIVATRELITPHSEEVNDWNIKVAPIFGVCHSTSLPFLNLDDSIVGLPAATSGVDRVDIVEVRGVYKTDTEEQRAFIDFDTKATTLQNVDTRKFLDVEIQVKQNSNIGSVEPPAKTNGWVKVAEIFIPGDASGISDCTINNITSDIYGLANDNWLKEEDSTYNVGYISEVNERFRKSHKADGTHNAASIDADDLNIGNGTNQINGTVLPTNKEINIGNVTKASTESISNVIESLGTLITTIYNSYLKFGGAYNYKGEIAISNESDENNALINALKLNANGDGTANVKIGDKSILTITADGTIRMSAGYTPSNSLDLVTKSVTDGLGTRLTCAESDIDELKNADKGEHIINEVLGRYTYKAYFQVATTENITLSGTQTVDGVALSIGDIVLVKDQTNQVENGIWEVQSGIWNRAANYINGNESNMKYKLFYPYSGTQAGRFYYIPDEEFTIGTSKLVFVESMFSSANIAGKAVIRDASGNISVNNMYGNVVGHATCASKNGSGVAFGTAAICSADAFRPSNWTPSVVACANRIVDHNGVATCFYWSGSNSNPSWVWGSNSEGTTCVYNPRCFTVKCADCATNVSNLKGYIGSCGYMYISPASNFQGFCTMIHYNTLNENYVVAYHGIWAGVKYYCNCYCSYLCVFSAELNPNNSFGHYGEALDAYYCQNYNISGSGWRCIYVKFPNASASNPVYYKTTYGLSTMCCGEATSPTASYLLGCIYSNKTPNCITVCMHFGRPHEIAWGHDFINYNLPSDMYLSGFHTICKLFSEEIK